MSDIEFGKYESDNHLVFDCLELGSIFKFGKYQVSYEKPWDLEWEIVHQEDDIQIARTTKYIDILQYDDVALLYGDSSPIFQRSSLGLWLNNITKKVNGINEKGFLYYFTTDELNSLNYYRFTIKSSALHSDSIDCIQKVFLPTITQLGFGQNNGVAEGNRFYKYKDIDSLKLDIHPNVIEYKHSIDFDTSEAYKKYSSGWTMSLTNDESMNFLIKYNGDLHYSSPSSNYGVAPCICLPRHGECK